MVLEDRAWLELVRKIWNKDIQVLPENVRHFPDAIHEMGKIIQDPVMRRQYILVMKEKVRKQLEMGKPGSTLPFLSFSTPIQGKNVFMGVADESMLLESPTPSNLRGHLIKNVNKFPFMDLGPQVCDPVGDRAFHVRFRYHVGNPSKKSKTACGTRIIPQYWLPKSVNFQVPTLGPTMDMCEACWFLSNHHRHSLFMTRREMKEYQYRALYGGKQHMHAFERDLVVEEYNAVNAFIFTTVLARPPQTLHKMIHRAIRSLLHGGHV